jgi:hypothetical protein
MSCIHTEYHFLRPGDGKIANIINCTLHLFKDQPADGPTIKPKHVAGFII